jgi:hypothetical protein
MKAFRNAHYGLTTPDLPCSFRAGLNFKKSAVVEMPQVGVGKGKRFQVYVAFVLQGIAMGHWPWATTLHCFQGLYHLLLEQSLH